MMENEIQTKTEIALDLMRRLPPQRIRRNLKNIIDIIPEITDSLLSATDLPITKRFDEEAKKYFLTCDYTRDGDSYRSPWTNQYFPPIDGHFPCDVLRQLEIEANDAFEQYKDMYYEGGLSSVFFWEVDFPSKFAGIILIKKDAKPSNDTDNATGSKNDKNDIVKGSWDSFNIIEVDIKIPSKIARYRLITTVMLSLESGNDICGVMNITGSLSKQEERDLPISLTNNNYNLSHICNIGKMVEEMENRIRHELNYVYFGKTRDIVNDLRYVQDRYDNINVQKKLGDTIMENKSTIDHQHKI
ncbi:hypothetical protein SNEBB_003590 [Seison nebaliae]|nr:hypothetical protein SNEBB_003590 [Seison nebaliae]